MANRTLATVFAAAIAVFALPVFAQDATKSAEGTGLPREAKPDRQQVVIVGASVSAGFADPTSKGPHGEVNRTYRLNVAFRKAWPVELARLSNFGDLMMFMQPETRGKKQLVAAKKRKPDVLIGVDFMIWFGYGSRRGNVKEGEVDEKRLEVQAEALAMLDGFDCPIVLGDYPDMSGASTHMLPKRMIPNKATLKALNAKLRTWAKKRKSVHIFPLARFVQEAVSKPQRYAWGKNEEVVLPKNFLLQSDRLHATKLGTLVIVLRIVEGLRGVLPKGHPLLEPAVTFRSLVEAAGLEDDIPEPKAKKKPVEKKPVEKRSAVKK